LPFRVVMARSCRVGLTMTCGSGGAWKGAPICAGGSRDLARSGGGAAECGVVPRCGGTTGRIRSRAPNVARIARADIRVSFGDKPFGTSALVLALREAPRAYRGGSAGGNASPAFRLERKANHVQSAPRPAH